MRLSFINRYFYNKILLQEIIKYHYSHYWYLSLGIIKSVLRFCVVRFVDKVSVFMFYLREICFYDGFEIFTSNQSFYILLNFSFFNYSIKLLF